MASTINADNGVVSGTSGLKSTADTSGVLALQSNGTTGLTLGTDLSVTVVGAGSIQGLTVGRGASALSTNTAFGSSALNNASTTGQYNTAIGRNTMQNLTSGEENTAVGNSVLNLATTGSNNVGVGNATLAATTTGGSNTALGLGALQRNTTASFNTAVGTQALTYNTTATYSTALGYQAGYNNTTGASGLFVGAQAGFANTTGNYNSFVGGQDGGGYGAGASNTTGSSNTALGSGALSRNTTASNNTAIGFQAGLLNTTGTQHTLVGYKAGASLTLAGGDGNTAVGYNALTSANGAACEVNTAIGSLALTSVTTGTGNTGCGYNSGANLTTGVRSTYIGRSATANNANAQEEIVIAAGACTSQGDNYVTIGKNGAKIYNKYDTNATWTYTSDGRLKQNITTDSLGLSFINRLRTVTYQWKPSNEVPSDMPQYGEVNTRNITTVMHGLIAQEVKAALDAEGVTTFAGWDQGPDGVQAVSREMFITPLIKAVQELTAQVESLKARLNAANL